jgi:type II secretory ATPase GspE/PulE/Tfp pilus assembly ATPase PilB-like protein
MDGIIKEGTIGSILFKSKIISLEDVTAALQEQKVSDCRFGEALVNLGVVTQEDIDWALANQLGLPYVRLKPEMIDREAVTVVPAALARQYCLIPLIRVGDELRIAMADPLNLAAKEAVERVSHCGVAISIALIREIREMQELFYGAEVEEETALFTSSVLPESALAAINADPTGAKLLDYLLLFAIQNKLISLSLQPLAECVAVLARKNGSLQEIGRLDAAAYPDLMVRIRRLAKMSGVPDASARGTLGFHYKGKNLLFQVLLLRGMSGDYVTLKLQVPAPFPATVTDLGVGSDIAARFGSVLDASHGLVLVALWDEEERARLLDLCLEEMETAGKNVLLLGEGLGRGDKRFPRFPLRSGQTDPHNLIMATLDHNPDILIIEDATDGQTFMAASKAAMHGKLVVAGVAYPDTASVFEHLRYFLQRDYFIPPYLKGIVVGKGVMTLCPDCRESYVPTSEELAQLRLPTQVSCLYRASGCPACEQTGYRGKRYLLDAIPCDHVLAGLLEKARDAEQILAYLRGRGYRGIAEQGAELLASGVISPTEYIASILI